GLVGYLMLFTAIGVFFVFFHLMLGRLVRPIKPDPEKLTIYECGEPTIGSAWIQFDLRFYVVALLFVIFDVEVAFFFPWAVVFGKATDLAQPSLAKSQRETISKQLQLQRQLPVLQGEISRPVIPPDDAKTFAWIAMLDIAVFFGVLLVGYAYL